MILTRCLSCHRHLLGPSAACPFCKASQVGQGSSRLALRVALTAAATAAAFVSGIGCAYGCPESACGGYDDDGGRTQDVNVGTFDAGTDTGVRDSGLDAAALDATIDAAFDAGGD